ncbi:hypothetical protein fugu_009798 [Takifugu bimaculatus]|uniref:RRM domain-containing protein n=1 Tax=Takifugu bimaculatus TaxID=433685 RepID=A0A4Z2CDT7_9TELE|nr:hypothetical protein fugu_009798 [Takifugu bimaculatus]
MRHKLRVWGHKHANVPFAHMCTDTRGKRSAELTGGITGLIWRERKGGSARKGGKEIDRKRGRDGERQDYMGKRLEQQQMYPHYTYYYPHYLQTKQSYVPPPPPMAPPSPGTTGGGGGGGGGGHGGGLAEQLSKTNLYIRGLLPATTDQDLIKLCQPYGKIVSTKAILDKNTNQCKEAHVLLQY